MQSAQVISAPPVGCPNPRFVQVLIDMRDEEKSLSSRKRRSIIKALESLLLYKLPFRSPNECLILNGFHVQLIEAMRVNLSKKPVAPQNFESSTSEARLASISEPQNSEFCSTSEFQISNGISTDRVPSSQPTCSSISSVSAANRDESSEIDNLGSTASGAVASQQSSSTTSFPSSSKPSTSRLSSIYSADFTSLSTPVLGVSSPVSGSSNGEINRKFPSVPGPSTSVEQANPERESSSFATNVSRIFDSVRQSDFWDVKMTENSRPSSWKRSLNTTFEPQPRKKPRTASAGKKSVPSARGRKRNSAPHNMEDLSLPGPSREIPPVPGTSGLSGSSDLDFAVPGLSTSELMAEEVVTRSDNPFNYNNENQTFPPRISLLRILDSNGPTRTLALIVLGQKEVSEESGISGFGEVRTALRLLVKAGVIEITPEDLCLLTEKGRERIKILKLLNYSDALDFDAEEEASDLKSANNAAGVVGDLLRGIAFCYIDFDFKLVTEKDKSLCDFSTAAGFGFVAFVTKSDGAVLMRNHPNKFWLPFSSQSIPKDFLCPDSLMLLTLSDDEASDFAPLTDAIYEAFEFCNLDHGIIAKTHSYKPGNAWKPCGAIENFGNDWETDSEPEVEIAQATASSSNPEQATESSSTQVDPNPTSSENLADLEIPQSYFDGDQDALEENQLETSPGSSVHSIPKSPEPSGRGIHAVSPSPPPSPTYDPFDALLNSVNGGNMNRFVSHGSSASAERSSCTETNEENVSTRRTELDTNPRANSPQLRYLQERNFTDPVRAFSQEIFVADDEIDAPSDKSDEEDFLSFSVESTGVSIVVDWAETVKKTKTNPFVSKLESKGASVVRKRLSVGDYLWVAHGSDGPESERLLSLPLVVERKRYDDLWSSIKDGRWREQKRRLKKTNLKVILLIEGKHNPRINGFPRQRPEGEDSALHPSKQSQEQALISAAVRDGMTVVHTKNVEESVNYLIQITNIFREVYSGRTLSSVTHQEFTCLKPNDPYPIKLMGFDYLQKFAVKTPGYSVRDVLAQGLLQVKGLTESKAKEIVTKYPTYRALWNAYLAIGEEPSDPNVGKDPVADEKKKLLKDLIDQGTGQKIGPAVSAVVWRTFCMKEYP